MSDANCALDDEGESLCACMNDFGNDDDSGCDRLNFGNYLGTELDAQTSYADYEGEMCDSGPSNEDGGDI